ncbi:MAG: DUF1707 SHOCT-like domain-containing protein [Pseudonocardiaceae bacterium]
MRIGDAEREEALNALGAHMSAGRLDIDEYGDRSARVTTARTRSELSALFADLPAPKPSFGTVDVQPVTEPPVPAPGWHGIPREVTGPIIGVAWVSAIFIGPALGLPWLFGVAIAVSIILGALSRKGGRDGEIPGKRRERRRMARDEMRERRREDR